MQCSTVTAAAVRLARQSARAEEGRQRLDES